MPPLRTAGNGEPEANIGTLSPSGLLGWPHLRRLLQLLLLLLLLLRLLLLLLRRRLRLLRVTAVLRFLLKAVDLGHVAAQ